MSTEHILGNTEHKRHVGVGMTRAITELSRRAIEHDDSKFQPEEFDHFAVATPKLKGLTYGTDEYREALKLIKPALEHHYANNPHHPEYYPGGITDMNFFDLIEMICDWRAASLRHADGDFEESLRVNKERFGISDDLQKMIDRTANILFPIIAAEVKVFFLYQSAYSLIYMHAPDLDFTQTLRVEDGNMEMTPDKEIFFKKAISRHLRETYGVNYKFIPYNHDNDDINLAKAEKYRRQLSCDGETRFDRYIVDYRV